ncbi:ATP-binding protein [Planctomycetales bacterium 10988]|nr:ATP-binding protein [Planctomycetales bacterium 10988]
MYMGVCDRGSRGGGLLNQIRSLIDRIEELNPNPLPIVVRSLDYPKTGKTCDLLAKEIISKRKGRRTTIENSDWRRMTALEKFREEHANNQFFDQWLLSYRPLTSLPSIRAILDLDNPPQLPSDQSSELPRTDPSDSSDVPAKESSGPSPLTEDKKPTGDIDIGLSRLSTQTKVLVNSQKLKRHAAFLGGTGSGKTTAAMNVIEQLLLDGIPAILLDRKGDLSCYAHPKTWSDSLNGPDFQLREQRRGQLQQKIDIAIYTPGNPEGRPLALPILPTGTSLLAEHEQEKLCRCAASSLVGMMGYSNKGASSKVAILFHALKLLCKQSSTATTLSKLIESIDSENSELVSAIGKLDVRNFEKIVEGLESIRTLKSHLFLEGGESLDAERLFGINNFASPQKTKLTIINLKFLDDLEDTQFWVSMLLMELERWTKQSPSEQLQGVILLDEADIYLPAMGKPATKQPLESLLKRARSAGLGILLATQSPGDFDYKCRDNIGTWMLGRIQSDTAIKKMKPLLEDCKSDVSKKLASQELGQFFLASEGDVNAVQSRCSAILTTQLSGTELLEAVECQKE